MEENTTIEIEQTADQQDAFLEGFVDETPETVEPADQQESGSEAPESGEEAETSAEDTDVSEQTAEASAETAEQTQETTWPIKVLGEDRVITAKDITPELLQKGYDYDRIREKYDEAKPVMEMFSDFAKKAGMSVADYAKFIRAEAKKAAGMNEAEAKRAVELEDREAAVAAKEAEATAAANATTAREARIKADLTEFAKAFPDVYKQAKDDPKVIPQSVWDAVNKGEMSLTAAYSRYAVAEAQKAVTEAAARAAANERNSSNAARATGSMRSAGSDTANRDAFLSGFNS